MICKIYVLSMGLDPTSLAHLVYFTQTIQKVVWAYIWWGSDVEPLCYHVNFKVTHTFLHLPVVTSFHLFLKGHFTLSTIVCGSPHQWHMYNSEYRLWTGKQPPKHFQSSDVLKNIHLIITPLLHKPPFTTRFHHLCVHVRIPRRVELLGHVYIKRLTGCGGCVELCLYSVCVWVWEQVKLLGHFYI